MIVPLAGRGQRYLEEGYGLPKPLIDVAGKPMLHWALKSIQEVEYSKIIFVALKEHDENYGIFATIKNLIKEAVVILIDEITEGQLCTVLCAKKHLNNPEDVLIIPSDTLVISDLHNDIRGKSNDCSGLISVTNLPGNQWSFAKLNDSGEVTEVAEKNRISNWASTGIYYFSNGKEMMSYAEEMINNQEKTLNEYYVIPLYQKMINDGLKIYTSKAVEMWDLGTPQAKEHFEKNFNIERLSI